jgi:hypothetical protein
VATSPCFFPVTNEQINTVFLKLSRRAESRELSQLVETFVDAAPLLTLLSTHDHQIIYGRRGTGKTHALRYLGETERRAGQVSAYVDMRTVGSTGGLYGDSSVPLPERATRLLADTLATVHESILTFAIESTSVDLAAISPILDRFAEGITQVGVSGMVERETTGERAAQSTASSSTRLSVSKDPGLSAEDSEVEVASSKDSLRYKETGTSRHRIHFGNLGQVFSELAQLITPKRVIILLDEWSSIPLDLQPYLADLIRRAILPHRGITVKIGAIEQRSTFQIAGERGDYLGLELGADVTADLNLDDFMVFENDAGRATQFFQELLYRHFMSVETTDSAQRPPSSTELVRVAFTQSNAFEEFVRASEGVPRDAINVLSAAAQKAFRDPISIPHVRAAAKSWFQRDKEAAVSANPRAAALLHWIVDDVIAHRRARAFLIEAGRPPDLIVTLFDARVLHVLKRNISAHDQPGVRYDVYKLDYGCYVDLLTTAKTPLGLLQSEDGSYVEVPPDDYRAIRRAILEIAKFQED